MVIFTFWVNDQDYKVHRDEIHTKLVQIIRERLLVHLRGLPQIVESWNRPDDSQPSQLARSLTKAIIFPQPVAYDFIVQSVYRKWATFSVYYREFYMRLMFKQFSVRLTIDNDLLCFGMKGNASLCFTPKQVNLLILLIRMLADGL
ncbi:hypothetical protein JRO89_XS05G0208300 [Xanthoceras sorbifolium]|uniref:Uncharacterized protein n=1 Tax=Xanthoceras sorbifolium TaxID=99658 RepID=A0ABQ8I2J4_9ROSI|nr:hypothetical protein JRO89_XS05G0208300 [Xanthoceras sorbifolium]